MARESSMSRRAAYAISWQFAEERRCLQCRKFLSEAQTAGMDLRHGFRWCEPCLITREAKLEAQMTMQSAWAALGALRTVVVSGAA